MANSVIVLSAAILAVATSAGVAHASPTPGSSPPASTSSTGNVVPISEATLEWRISDCAFSACASLTQSQSLSGSVSREDSAWVFRQGTGTYHQVHGTSVVRFDGSIALGNTAMGNYTITLADPVVRVSRKGDGVLRADVTVRVAGSVVVQADGVTIVALPGAGHAAAWTVTPPWDGVGTPGDPAPYLGRQFAQEFIDVLPVSLRAWFWSTGETGLNATKAPAEVSLDADRAYRPTLVVHPKKPISRTGMTALRVTGLGFDPGLQGGAVQGVYVVFGPNPQRIPDGYTNTAPYTATAYLPEGPDERGRLTTTLAVPGAKGVTSSGPGSRPGVSTWAAHSRATTAWDAFVRVPIARR